MRKSAVCRLVFAVAMLFVLLLPEASQAFAARDDRQSTDVLERTGRRKLSVPSGAREQSINKLCSRFVWRSGIDRFCQEGQMVVCGDTIVWGPSYVDCYYSV